MPSHRTYNLVSTAYGRLSRERGRQPVEGSAEGLVGYDKQPALVLNRPSPAGLHFKGNLGSSVQR